MFRLQYGIELNTIQYWFSNSHFLLYLFAIYHKNVVTYIQVVKSCFGKNTNVCDEKYITTYTNLV